MSSNKCEHNKQKSICKECGGSQICEHNKRKSRCKECGGSSICIHNREKSCCKECKGASICEHNIVKSGCRQCHGSQICEHNKIKSYCRECKGKYICEHNREKRYCKQCHGHGLCEHAKNKNLCKQCHGISICEHNRVKSRCVECYGSQICEHNKRKSSCKSCGGSELCKTPLCETHSNKKYKGYCLLCFIHLFPDEPNIRNFKTKEKATVDFILEHFSKEKYTWVADKKIKDGCSNKRPDLILDLGYQIIIIEIDENQHHDYDCSCENKRLMILSQDVGHRPIIFIRFNPDSYRTKDGIITSCWSLNKMGTCTVKKSKQKEWQERLNSLKVQIEYWMQPDNKTSKMVEVIQLFYDNNEVMLSTHEANPSVDAANPTDS